MLKIRKAGHRELERYYPIFELDFDKKELLPKLGIHMGMLNGSWELLIIYEEESRLEAAYALVGKKSLYGYTLLKYFAVLPWYRDKGLGVEAMRLINAKYPNTQGIIAEITGLSGRDETKVRKLKRFFSRFGYEESALECHIGDAKAHIMVKPIKGSADINATGYRILPNIYSDIFGERGAEQYISVTKP